MEMLQDTTMPSMIYRLVREFTIMPGTAGGTRLFNNVSVYSATCSGVALSGHSAPGVTMLGFRRIPSNNTWFSAKKKNTFDQTFSATSKVLLMLWLPSRRISGSTIGTNPLSCTCQDKTLSCSLHHWHYS